jgi:hypothetical protein
VKQLCADDSAATSVKVGYRQASYIKTPSGDPGGVFSFALGPRQNDEPILDKPAGAVAGFGFFHWHIKKLRDILETPLLLICGN